MYAALSPKRGRKRERAIEIEPAPTLACCRARPHHGHMRTQAQSCIHAHTRTRRAHMRRPDGADIYGWVVYDFGKPGARALGGGGEAEGGRGKATARP